MIDNEVTMEINWDQDVDRIDDPYANLSDEEINDLRESFLGGAKKWATFAANRLGLDFQTEKKLKIQVNKARDIRQCGKPIMSFNDKGEWAETGRFQQCNRPNECQRCANRQKRQLKNRLQSLDGQKYKEIEKSERAGLMAEYDKDEVYFQPLPNGKVLAVSSSDSFDGEEMTYQLAEHYAQVLPEGTKTSGNLGKVTTPKEQDENLIPILHNEYIVEDKKELEPVIEKVMAKTADLLPKTPKELQDAINDCEYWFKRYAKELDIKIYLHRRVSFLVDQSKIDWSERFWKAQELKFAPVKPSVPS